MAFARIMHLMLAACAAFFGVTAEPSAQAYPTRPITVVVPSPPEVPPTRLHASLLTACSSRLVSR
jgi:hypothetical protein